MTLYVTGVRQPVIRVGGFPALVDRIERSAPGERAVRFTVPAGTEAGAAVPITIESGAHPGQQGVTIAVRD